jgi:hypothetical protein
MPFPLLSHQGIAAPGALVARGRLDTVALMVGTIAPDLPLALDRSRFDFDAISHTWLGLLVWSLPVTVVATWLFRRFVAWPLAVHLPDGGRLRLRDVGRAADDRPTLVVTVASALLGALTHVLADGFTHPEPWAASRLPILEEAAPLDLPDPGRTNWYDILHLVLNVGGVLVLVACLFLAARLRDRTAGPLPALPTPTAASRTAFWGLVAAGTVVGSLLALRVWGVETMAQGTMLFTWAVALGFLGGALWSRRHLTFTHAPRQ